MIMHFKSFKARIRRSALYIYKYRKFDQNSLSALKENKIWFSQGIKFNDPFDCSVNVPVNLMSKEALKEFICKNITNSEIFEIAKNNDYILNEVINKQMEDSRLLIDTLGVEHHELAPIFNIVAATLLRSFVCCFSTTSTNPLLWSHYADSHSGFCIRFKKEILLRDLPISEFGSVIYNNEPVNVMKGIYDGSNLAKNIIFSKSEAWAYEKEYRFIHNELAMFEADFYRVCTYSDEAIDCIILGFSADTEALNKLREVLEGKNILIKKIIRSKHGFELYVDTNNY